MNLKMPETVLQQIREHGARSYPEEGAGLIFGRDDGRHRIASHLYPLHNRFEAASRHHRYKIDPGDMLKGEQHAEQMGLDVIGVFHSHPDHPAAPSEYDRQWALPWYSYVITSVIQGKATESRAWRLLEDRTAFTEQQIETMDIPLPERKK